jgi:RimJ/RimL family protein N-acetyltransferase
MDDLRLDYPLTELTNGVIRLRPWRLDDTACIKEASDEGRIPEFTTVPVEFSPEAGEAFVRRQWDRVADGRAVSMAVADCAGDVAVGLVFLEMRPQHGVAGLGYWLAPSGRGRRLATQAARLVSDWALDTMGLARVEAWVEPDNGASSATLLGAGFSYEGRLRSFLTVGTRRADADVFSRVAEDGTHRLPRRPGRAQARMER